MSEAPLTTCTACHSESLQKLVSAAGFQLKGTGWYATDFRHKGKPEPKDKQEKKTESTTETKQTTDKPSAGGTSSSSKGQES
ncbi:MAG: Type I antifreeze protein [uncultured bacterium]|nr:MAG: Type I antifreeze protein [uncultured bacterium]